VSVELSGLSERLISSDYDIAVPAGWPVTADSFSRSKVISRAALAADSATPALDWVEELFYERGLEGVPRAAISDWQHRLLRRQIQ
jgi:hypothetical protein